MLSRKDYRKLAEVIRTSHNKEEAIKKIMVFLKADNPKFNEEKFARASGYELMEVQ